MLTISAICEKYRDIVNVLSEDVYTYCGDEGLIYDECPFDDFEWYTGASKVCIVRGNYAFKTSFSGYAFDYDMDSSDWYDETRFEKWDIDYCAMEYELYQRACVAGLGKFFCKMFKLNDKVYAQERCEEVFDYFISFVDEEDLYPHDNSSYNDFTSILDCAGLYNLRVKIGVDAMRYLVYQASLDELCKLQDFFCSYDVNDLHKGNFGWFNGKLKFFDFCGYNSNTNEKLKAA